MRTSDHSGSSDHRLSSHPAHLAPPQAPRPSLAMTAPRTRLHVTTDLAGGIVGRAGPVAGALLRRRCCGSAPGDAVALFNGRDGEWLGRIDGIGKRGAGDRVRRASAGAQAAEGDLWLVFAPIKRARIDFLVEKATELGVSALIPVMTERTIVERAQSRSAARQCHRGGRAERAADRADARRAAAARRAARALAGGARRLHPCDETRDGAADRRGACAAAARRPLGGADRPGGRLRRNGA